MYSAIIDNVVRVCKIKHIYSNIFKSNFTHIRYYIGGKRFNLYCNNDFLYMKAIMEYLEAINHPNIAELFINSYIYHYSNKDPLQHCESLVNLLKDKPYKNRARKLLAKHKKDLGK